MIKWNKLRVDLFVDELKIDKTIIFFIIIEASMLFKSRKINFKMSFVSNVSSIDENDFVQFFKMIESLIDKICKSSIDDFVKIRDFIYKLILIIVFSISTNVWNQKFKVFFNFKVYYYLDNRSHFKKLFHFFDAVH